MRSPLTIIEKKQVMDMNLLESSLPEDEHPVYSPMATYTLGQRVILTTGYHKVYESLANGNAGFFPPDNLDKWAEVGPTNRFALFDDSIESKSMGMETLSFKVALGRVNALSLLGLSAGQIRIQVFSPGLNMTLFDKTYSGTNRTGVNSWYKYFFSPIRPKTVLTVLNIPSTVDAEITVTLTGVGQVSAGVFVAGMGFEVGDVQYGARPGIIDFSRKETDQFGKTKLIKRSFTKRMDVEVWVDNTRADAVQQKLEDLRATPAVWVGANELYESLTVFGFARDFSVAIQYPTMSVLSLQIEGLA